MPLWRPSSTGVHATVNAVRIGGSGAVQARVASLARMTQRTATAAADRADLWAWALFVGSVLLAGAAVALLMLG
jgi:hypothetical protein